MSPDECIAALDRALADPGGGGEWIVLRRVVGTGAVQINIDVDCRAFVRAFKPEQLVGGVNQTDSHVILSPSEINRAQWPGGRPPAESPRGADPRVPPSDGNGKALIKGRVRNIAFAQPFYVSDVLVRLELTVAG